MRQPGQPSIRLRTLGEFTTETWDLDYTQLRIVGINSYRETYKPTGAAITNDYCTTSEV